MITFYLDEEEHYEATIRGYQKLDYGSFLLLDGHVEPLSIGRILAVERDGERIEVRADKFSDLPDFLQEDYGKAEPASSGDNVDPALGEAEREQEQARLSGNLTAILADKPSLIIEEIKPEPISSPSAITAAFQLEVDEPIEVALSKAIDSLASKVETVPEAAATAVAKKPRATTKRTPKAANKRGE